MTTPDDDKAANSMIEEVVGAWRPASHYALRFHPAWHDLAEDERQLAFEETLMQRQLEAQLDPAGLSSTAHLVLARIRQTSE